MQAPDCCRPVFGMQARDSAECQAEKTSMAQIASAVQASTCALILWNQKHVVILQQDLHASPITLGTDSKLGLYC